MRKSRKRKNQESDDPLDAGPSKRRRFKRLDESASFTPTMDILQVQEAELRQREQQLQRHADAAEKMKNEWKKSVEAKKKADAQVKEVTSQLLDAKNEVQSLSQEIARLEDAAKKTNVATASTGMRPSVQWILEQLEEQYQCSLCVSFPLRSCLCSPRPSPIKVL